MLTTLLSFGFGVFFVSTLLVIAVVILLRDKPVPPEAMWILRVVLSLAAGGIGAVLPGFLDIRMGSGEDLAIRAGGALALTLLVYRVNPPSLIALAKPLPKPASPIRHFRGDPTPELNNGQEK